MASCTAPLVISLKTARRGSLRFRVCLRDQAIHSPSRSGSGARNTSSARFEAAFRSSMSLSFFSIISYCGAKSLRVFTPSPFLGKSIIWPIEARTSKSRPRNFSIVLALAGDSTITSFFVIISYPDLYRPIRLAAMGAHSSEHSVSQHRIAYADKRVGTGPGDPCGRQVQGTVWPGFHSQTLHLLASIVDENSIQE